MTVTPDLLDALARRGTDTLVLGPEVIGNATLVRHVAALEGVVAASYAAGAELAGRAGVPARLRQGVSRARQPASRATQS